jgi:hypothetical protein
VPNRIDMSEPAAKASPSVLLQRKLKYLGILKKRFAKQDLRVEAAKEALDKAQAALEAAQARGRDLLAKQDQALRERAELAQLIEPTPESQPSEPAWMGIVAQMATTTPASPAATLPAQFHELAAKLEALAAAPPSTSPLPAAVPTPPADRHAEPRATERREGRSRTPEPKRQKERESAPPGGQGSGAAAGSSSAAGFLQPAS